MVEPVSEESAELRTIPLLRGDPFGSQRRVAAGGARGGQIWAGGQPGPEILVIQQILKREMIFSGQIRGI